MSCDEREFSIMENGCLKDFYFDDSFPWLRLSPLQSHEERVIPDKPHVLPMPKQAKLVWGLSDDDVKRLRAKNIVPDKKTRNNHFMLRIASPWLWRFFKSDFGVEWYAKKLEEYLGSLKLSNLLEIYCVYARESNFFIMQEKELLNVLVNGEEVDKTEMRDVYFLYGRATGKTPIVEAWEEKLADEQLKHGTNRQLQLSMFEKLLNNNEQIFSSSEDAEETDNSFLKRKSFPVKSMSKSLLDYDWAKNIIVKQF